MTSLNEFISAHEITMTVKAVDHNPSMTGDDRWAAEASHYLCTLKRRGQFPKISVYFSMGSAHTEPPKVADVLDCLASDAAGIENASDFEDWCSEYGYDTDSRKAEKTFRAVQRGAAKLKRLMAEDYETLLFDTERL